MELSRQADYAVRAVIELAKAPTGSLLRTGDIADRQNIPEKYLPAIVRTLARAGLLRTMRGSQGGISLSRNPEDITLLEVVEAIDGQMLLNRCRIRPGECVHGGNPCKLHEFWERMTDEIESRLAAVNLLELAAG